jgi:protein-S-isoprenylcysteine O-methyltransferase Ste14
VNLRELAAPTVALVLRGRTMQHLIARLVGYLAVLLLFAVAFSFLIAALYLAFATVWPEPLAALATTAVLAAAGGLILLALQRPRRPAPAPAASNEALLLALGEAVRRHPWSTVVMAAALGVLAEMSTGSGKGTRPKD